VTYGLLLQLCGNSGAGNRGRDSGGGDGKGVRTVEDPSPVSVRVPCLVNRERLLI
jgi:hypothetical protein